MYAGGVLYHFLDAETVFVQDDNGNHGWVVIDSVLHFQMAAKMGDQPNMNSSSPVIDPSLYVFGGQKRSLDNGGQPSAWTHHANITVEQLLQVSDLNLCVS